MRPKLTYANVVATLALFIALGGASYAALKLPKNSVGTKQLKKNAVTLAKINPSARTSLEGQKGDTGPRGEPGPIGPAGSGGFDGAAAGGDLTGTYPNPRVGLVQVGGAEETESEGFAFLLPPWAGFADITTDGDSDQDHSVRILNTGSQTIKIRDQSGQTTANNNQVASFTFENLTTFLIWSVDGARSWLVTCADDLKSTEIRCQGLANRVG
jgi:hypothetical protein